MDLLNIDVQLCLKVLFPGDILTSHSKSSQTVPLRVAGAGFSHRVWFIVLRTAHGSTCLWESSCVAPGGRRRPSVLWESGRGADGTSRARCQRIVSESRRAAPLLDASDLGPEASIQMMICLHGDQRIEVKALQYLSGWQGHNREGW
jgi:hypothetical protein